MSRLRSFLDEVGAGDLILTDGNGYYLNFEQAGIDLIDFEDAANAALAKGVRQRDELEAALRLWTGKPFEDTGNEVLDQWSRRLAEVRSRLLESLTLECIAAGQPQDATQLCRELLLDEPWRESSWSALIVALYRSGRTNDALKAFSEAGDILRKNFGLEPGPVLQNLELLVLTHDPVLAGPQWRDALLR